MSPIADVVEHPSTALERVSPHGTPMPIFTGQEMTNALTAYRALQTALDNSMPEQIMQLDGKPFRKKGYWRAIAVAFNLTVEPIDERRDVSGTFEDGRENFGFVVTYRATSPTGRSMTGDGACFAIEKARRFKCPHPQPDNANRTIHWPHESCPSFDPAFSWKALPGQATEHNVRSHAHTRAFNRAVSNLVGFGEVSAEEVDRDDTFEASSATKSAGTSATRSAHADAFADANTVQGEVVGTLDDARPANFGGTTTTAPATAPAPLRDGEHLVHVTRVVKVKEGSNAKGPWVLYGIETQELGANVRVTTFSKTDAKLANDSKGAACAATWTEERKGNFTNRSLAEGGIRILPTAPATADREVGAEG